MPNPPLAPKVDTALGGRLITRIHELRNQRKSWDKVAVIISDESGMDVSREWCRRQYEAAR